MMTFILNGIYKRHIKDFLMSFINMIKMIFMIKFLYGRNFLIPI